MRPLKKTLFISDIHLSTLYPAVWQNLSHLLDQLSPTYIDKVYILGDLFETWIGDDDKTVFHQEVIHQLQDVVGRGIPIMMINGNRDFLLGEKFAKAAGCQLLDDIAVISLYGERVVIMHGDLLCTKDKNYLKMRKIFRNKYLQKLFLMLPLSIRMSIANKIRQRSEQHTQSVAMAMMDVTEAEVIKTMQQHAVRYLIHGHTHKQNLHHVELADPAQRIVLGDWHHSGSVLVWDQKQQKQLYNFNSSDSLNFLTY